jgi:hypothetical protein
MKVLNRVWFLCFAVILFVGNPAIGDERVDKEQAQAVVGSIFDLLDCETTGSIDTFEVDDHFSQVWLPADRDHSRTLSRREYAYTHYPMSKGKSEALFREADANSDGQLQAMEFRLHLQRMIQALDADGNREVTRQEAGLKPHPSPKSLKHEHKAHNKES